MRNIILILITVYYILNAFVVLAVFNLPTELPPAGNTNLPLNVGSALQTKLGKLNLGLNLFVTSTTTADGFCFHGSPQVCLTAKNLSDALGGSSTNGGGSAGTTDPQGALAVFRSEPYNIPKVALTASQVFQQPGGFIEIPQHNASAVTLDVWYILNDKVPYGVRADASGANGIVGIGNFGLKGHSPYGNIGVYGRDSSQSVGGFGVYGLSGSSGGTGVLGVSDGFGISNAPSAGVFEYKNSTNPNAGYALKTSGNVYLNVGRTNVYPYFPSSKTIGDYQTTGRPLDAQLSSRLGIGYDPTDSTWPKPLTTVYSDGYPNAPKEPGIFFLSQKFPSADSGVFAVADFNNDGQRDVAAGYQDGKVYVSLNSGDGTGKLLQSTAVSGSNGRISSITTANLDGKNATDLIVGTDANNIYIFLNKGNGTFTLANYFYHYQPFGITTADMNGDGRADLVAYSYYQPYGISVFINKNDGTGSFNAKVDYPFVSSVDYSSGSNVAIVVNDFNGDRKPDVAATNSHPRSGVVSVFLNKGDGTLLSPKEYSAGSTVGETDSLASGDIDGQNGLDLIMARKGTNLNEFLIFYNKGDGTFVKGPSLVVTDGLLSAGWVAQFGVADFNDDDKPDIASSCGVALVCVLFNKGSGVFVTDRYRSGSNIRNVVIGDLNNDSKSDIISDVILLNNPGLTTRVKGNVGAEALCDEAGTNCLSPAQLKSFIQKMAI